MPPNTIALPPRARSVELSSAADQHAAVVGFCCAIAAALIMAATIAVSRLALKTDLAPADLLVLRFGLAGILFLPILVHTWPSLPHLARRAALPLSFVHGWGMAGLSITGMVFAPAAHAAALGPGLTPLFVAILAMFVFRQHVVRLQAVGLSAILIGALTLFLTSATSGLWSGAIVGDLMFVGAAMLAAIYLVTVEHLRIPALAGNALVFVFSALVVVPIYFLMVESRIPGASPSDIAMQALFQGGLMPLAYVATHHAVLKIGGARVTMIMASIPVITLVTGRLIAGDTFTFLDVVAIVTITGGVLCGAMFKLRAEGVMHMAAQPAAKPEMTRVRVR